MVEEPEIEGRKAFINLDELWGILNRVRAAGVARGNNENLSSMIFSPSLMVISPLLCRLILKKYSQARERRCSIKSRTHSAFGYILFWIGLLLTICGLCILLINLLRH